MDLWLTRLDFIIKMFYQRKKGRHRCSTLHLDRTRHYCVIIHHSKFSQAWLVRYLEALSSDCQELLFFAITLQALVVCVSPP